MYVFTNRHIHPKAKGLKKFGKEPNAAGPNTLRIIKVNKQGSSYKATEVRDTLTAADIKKLNTHKDYKDFALKLDPSKKYPGSLKAAVDLFAEARKGEGKSILVYVHGYNNDVADVMAAAHELEALYDVIVVPFTWPANGGGALTGTASYLSDKQDARVSAGALNRFIGKLYDYHLMLTEANVRKIRSDCQRKHSNNPEEAARLFSELIDKECKTKISLISHSMGNYVLKHTLKTSDNATSNLVFDNICLVAADANNHDHQAWVEKLDVRKRLYVVINEDDFALRASRIKPGEEQKARLGHSLINLNAINAHYVDLTEQPHVGSDHAYFKGSSVKRNPAIRAMFDAMFKGKAVEKSLRYFVEENVYRPQD